MIYSLLNRAVLIIKPKQPFLDWLYRLPNPLETLTLDELQHNCDAILIPQPDSEDEIDQFIQSQWPTIFEMELDSWHTRDAEWPAPRTLKMFREWFAVELHEMVWDSVKGPLRRERADV